MIGDTNGASTIRLLGPGARRLLLVAGGWRPAVGAGRMGLAELRLVGGELRGSGALLGGGGPLGGAGLGAGLFVGLDAIGGDLRVFRGGYRAGGERRVRLPRLPGGDAGLFRLLAGAHVTGKTGLCAAGPALVATGRRDWIAIAGLRLGEPGAVAGIFNNLERFVFEARAIYFHAVRLGVGLFALFRLFVFRRERLDAGMGLTDFVLFVGEAHKAAAGDPADPLLVRCERPQAARALVEAGELFVASFRKRSDLFPSWHLGAVPELGVEPFRRAENRRDHARIRLPIREPPVLFVVDPASVVARFAAADVGHRLVAGGAVVLRARLAAVGVMVSRGDVFRMETAPAAGEDGKRRSKNGREERRAHGDR